MVYKIIIGRNEADRKKLGEKGIIFLGKQYVKMGETTSLSNEVFLDIARAHVILCCGKRGSGKSYSLAVIAEEIASLPEEIGENLAVLMIDTMGIFWTMKYPNIREETLLKSWGLNSKKIDKIDIYTPKGYFKKHKKEGIPTDYSFSIKVSELNAADWCNSFDIKLTDPLGIFIERIISDLKEEFNENYGIDDIITAIEKDKRVDKTTKDAAENRFLASKTWGLFSKTGTEVKDILKPGRVSILDVSCYARVAGEWGIKNLVTGIIAKKLLVDRIVKRKVEELKDIELGQSYFGFTSHEEKREMPLIWLLIDESHGFLPRERKTAATDALVQLLREGRQPGISMILATQQPGEIHKDVITQSDIVLSHRVTAKKDVDALNEIMQTYLAADILSYLNNLPRLKGSAIILDDNSERIYPIRVRPRFTWHGGEAPTAVKIKKKELLDLEL